MKSPSSEYERLEEVARPKPVRDLSQAWERYRPLGEASEVVLGRIRHFCAEKRTSLTALECMGTRWTVRTGGAVWLAWAATAQLNGARVVTAVKARELGSGQRSAEPGSTFLEAPVFGNPAADDWYLFEGESDAARGLELVTGKAAVMVLPAGALTFRREWANVVPRGATVFCCHDADEAGDRGAAKVARILGDGVVRLRPPIEGGDWCDWAGDCEAFAELVAAARETTASALEIVSLDAFTNVEEPGAEALVGELDDALIPENGDVMLYGDGGAGKTTLGVDLGFHLAAGDDWLGIRVPRAVRVLLVENEGPRPLFRAKLRRKREGWLGSELGERLSVLEKPWGQFSFAEASWREAIAAKISEREVEVVILGPVTRLGMNEAGTLQEVRDFMALVDQVRAQAARGVVVVLIHHENKGGQVSGAWEGAGDTLFHVQAQGHGSVRLHVQKARWSSSWHKKTLQLTWAEGEGFSVEEKEELDDETLAEQILATIRHDPGRGWGRVEEATPGVNRQRRMAVRDGLLSRGQIVNVGKDADGEPVALAYCPERRPARFYLVDDPTISHLLPASGADGEQIAPAGAVGGSLHLLPAPRLIGEQGAGADVLPPSDEVEP